MSATDLSEFLSLSDRQRNRHRCPVSKALEALDADQAEQLRAALDFDPADITAHAIAQWIKQRDLYASHQAVYAHRNGTCACVRS